jgi:hypothetical protein
MSIIRHSSDREQLYAPEPDGTMVDRPFDERKLTGRLEAVKHSSAKPKLERTPMLQRVLEAQLATATSQLRPSAPVVVLVHGFLFDPFVAVGDNPSNTDNAHGRLFHFLPVDDASAIREHTTSWPLGLGIRDDKGQSGLAIAFGWKSSPGLASSLLTRFGNIYARAYDYAELAAWSLAHVLQRLAAQPALAGHRLDILCHSLGTRVVIRALALCAKEDVRENFIARLGRVVLLGGSEYVVEAQLMYKRLLDASLVGEGRAHAGPHFYNIGCRENDVLDKLGENFGPRTFGNHNVIGHNGLGSLQSASHWIDLQIDSHALRTWFAQRDTLDISGDQPGNIWDHWYYYTHSGNMRFLNQLLRERDRFALPALRNPAQTHGPIPEGIAPTGWFGD